MYLVISERMKEIWIFMAIVKIPFWLAVELPDIYFALRVQYSKEDKVKNTGNSK